MKEPLDVRMCDFDNVSYHVSVNPEAAGILNVSMTCGCWDQLKALGAEAQLQALYGDILVPADSTADVALRINLNEPVANPGLYGRFFFFLRGDLFRLAACFSAWDLANLLSTFQKLSRVLIVFMDV